MVSLDEEGRFIVVTASISILCNGISNFRRFTPEELSSLEKKLDNVPEDKEGLMDTEDKDEGNAGDAGNTGDTGSKGLFGKKRKGKTEG